MLDKVEVFWRNMLVSDLGAVEAIADRVHPDFPEAPEVFAERHRLHPGGCRLLELDGVPSGYVLSHPFVCGALPALDAILGEIPKNANTFYVHDLALLPIARGTGAAGKVVADLVGHAVETGFASMSLVSVNQSRRFWEKHGFVAQDTPDLAPKLESYKAAARYMVRHLA